MRKKSIKQRVKYIQAEFKKGLSATWNAVNELAKIEKERSWFELEGYEKYTFKAFVISNFNITMYQFRKLQELMQEFDKKDFDTFGPKILSQVKKTKRPNATLKKLRKMVKENDVISIKSLKEIINLEKQVEKRPTLPTKRQLIAWLNEEIDLWVKQGWISDFQAEKLKEVYGIKTKKRA